MKNIATYDALSRIESTIDDRNTKLSDEMQEYTQSIRSDIAHLRNDIDEMSNELQNVGDIIAEEKSVRESEQEMEHKKRIAYNICGLVVMFIGVGVSFAANDLYTFITAQSLFLAGLMMIHK